MLASQALPACAAHLLEHFLRAHLAWLARRRRRIRRWFCWRRRLSRRSCLGRADMDTTWAMTSLERTEVVERVRQRAARLGDQRFHRTKTCGDKTCHHSPHLACHWLEFFASYQKEVNGCHQLTRPPTHSSITINTINFNAFTICALIWTKIFDSKH